jgi:hypothetical protein
MEDVQLSKNTTDSSNMLPERGVEFITAEAPIIPTEEQNMTVENSAPALDPPKMMVEVVVEKKVELEPEDPILPDHYYDNGNIPVFKPVFINEIPCG